MAFDLNPQHYSRDDKVGACLQKLLVSQHLLSILQTIRIHLHDPVDKFHVKLINHGVESLTFLQSTLLLEGIDIFWVAGYLFLKRAHIDKEVARIDLEIVVQNNYGAKLLKGPDFLIDGRLLIAEELPID